MAGGDLPVVDPPAPEAGRGDPRVVGVLLAAGESTRFGDANKLLATVDGEPIVRRSARALVDSRVTDVLVVVGYEAERVREALDGLDVRVVENPDYAGGQSTSVRAGVAAARASDADAVVVGLGDMPFVEPATVDRLVAAYEGGAGDALAAAHEGRRGNPVLFDRRFFDDLEDVGGDTGGREILIAAGDAALVETGDPGVRRDVDTREDLGSSP